MCGIFCYCSLHHDKSLSLKDHSQKITHRGPDHHVEPVEVDTAGHCHFGFHRLMINGLDDISNQPLVLGDYSLICNGEIYNHRQLEQEFGFTTFSHSDCEVILHLYAKFGIEKTVKLLYGVFSFCLFDRSTNTLHFARDPIGIRPSFFGLAPGTIAIASEAKAIYGLVKQVQHVPPGHYCSLSLSDLKNKVLPPVEFNCYYFYHENVPEDRDVSNGELVKIHKDIYTLVDDAVDIRVKMSDRPVGVFLSGGVDSSLVASLAKRKCKELHSFAIGLVDSPDLVKAREVADFLGTIHHEITFTVEDGQRAVMELIYHLESPDITTARAGMPMYLLSKYIKENTDITVLLSGEGPDEVFSGYLYNAYAPSPAALHEESVWRVKHLHKTDVDRSDRTTSAWSLEVRVPLLCSKLVSYVHSLPPKLRDPKYNNMIEKYLFRKSFEGYDLLPNHILWRPKEAFSDGVGYSWVDGIKAFAERTVSQMEWEQRETIYPVLTPPTKEAYMYRVTYEQHFPSGPEQPLLMDYYWLPKWSDHKEQHDPSARVLKIHDETVKQHSDDHYLQ